MRETAEKMWFDWCVAGDIKKDSMGLKRPSVRARAFTYADMIIVLTRLIERKKIEKQHLLVLKKYGEKKCVPQADKLFDVKMWNEAIDALADELRYKGVL